MKTKEEAWQLVKEQLDNRTQVSHIDKYKLSEHIAYGKMEIKELLDYIYDEKEVKIYEDENL